MKGRFLTPKSGAEQLLKQRPALGFAGSTKTDWRNWRRRFGAALRRVMGNTPPKPPLRVRVLSSERRDGYTRQKIAFNPDPFSTVVAYLLIPEGGGRRPGVLCAHGHGGGKEELFDTASPYHDIAQRLVRAGYVVIAPDWRSFGERQDDKSYIGHFGDEHGRDGCDLSYMLYGYFGYQMLTLDVADARRCLDVLAARRDVDASRLGMVGLSFGGTMATYTAALDARIKAVVISGYLSTIADALGDRGGGNTCGSQFLFGLRTIGDIADVAGLIAPRACQVQMGTRDTIFEINDATRAYRHLQKIYRAAGASKQLEPDRFDGVHELDADAAMEFLSRHLGV
jgi:dienelactone hydrolase